MKQIVIGVINQPYGADDNNTTAQVASGLQEKYGLFSQFVFNNKQFISNELVKSYAGAVNSINAGRNPNSGFLSAACAQIQRKFKRDILNQSAEEWGMDGVPTLAALMGINHRFKSGLNGVTPAQLRRFIKSQSALPSHQRKVPIGTRRPSFVDTGIFVNSIHVWEE